MLYQEKSGNPAVEGTKKIMSRAKKFSAFFRNPVHCDVERAN
jgi:hypothetical protein